MRSARRGPIRALARVPGIAAAVGLAAAAAAAVPYHVSQKGRVFTPATLRIQAGDAVEFANDDGDLLHHAFLKSDRFSFDTGDQEPGAKMSVVFPARGTFTVLCAIHPRMKLVVQVE